MRTGNAGYLCECLIYLLYIYLIYLVLIYKRILLVRLPVHKHNEYVRIYVYFYLILDRVGGGGRGGDKGVERGGYMNREL